MTIPSEYITASAQDKCVCTVATQKKYFHFAFALARSYRYHNREGVPFYIISDHEFDLPKDLSWVKKKIVSPELMGKGVEYRFNLDKICPEERSIFIDADSLIYKNIESLFELPNTSMQVIGLPITEGDWDELDIPVALERFNIPYIIRYGGAFYYIIKNNLSSAICTKARELAKSGYPFQRHTYSVNDEPILSVSMAAFGVHPIGDTGNLWGDIHQLISPNDLNILRGITHFNNVPGSSRFKFWLPNGNYSPMILHFGGANYNKNPWVFDALRLKLYYQWRLNEKAADTIVDIFKRLYFFAKSIRNLFH